MAIIMLRVRGLGLPPELLGWLATERGAAEMRCHFRRTWRGLETETWRPMELPPDPTPAHQLIQLVEDVAREIWAAIKSKEARQ